jgi:hypothetical protein
MPNLLAHFGLQGLVMQPAVRKADAIWVMTGCLIPDIPWILQRAARAILPGIDLYDLRLYALVQATLLFSLLLSSCLSAVSRTPVRTFAILAFGAALGLLLDALETKWANGVHLLAPFSWDLLNIGLFWPESPIVLAATGLGLAYGSWVVWSTCRRTPQEARLLQLDPTRLGVVGMVLVIYMVAPMALRRYPQMADNHYVATLRDRAARAGSYVEFDRRPVVRTEQGVLLRTFAGEHLWLEGDPVKDSGLVSVRGEFVDENTVAVLQLYQHSPWSREAASYLALLILGLAWIAKPRSGQWNV